MPGLRPHRQPGRGGAELPESGHPGAGAGGRSGGRDAGQRRQAADHAPCIAGGERAADGVCPTLPAAGVPAAAGGAGRRAVRLPGDAGGADGAGIRHGRRGRGKAALGGADLRRLRCAPPRRGDRCPLPGAEAVRRPAGLGLSGGKGCLCGWLFLLQPGGGGHTGDGAASGQQRDGDTAGRRVRSAAVPERAAAAGAAEAHGGAGAQ